jgi:hypothetical protein
MRDFKGISKFKPASASSSWLEWTSPLIGGRAQTTPGRDNEGSTNRGSTGGRQSVFSDGRTTRTQADIETPGPGQRMSVEEDFGVDIDLSPQLNLALREEVSQPRVMTNYPNLRCVANDPLDRFFIFA